MVGRNILENKNISKFELLTPSSIELNLLNFEDVDKYIKINQPNFIIHAAGKVGGIQANIANPTAFLVENLDMGRNIIMAAYKNNIKNLLNLGSSCMYPRNAKNPLTENLILDGKLEPTNEGYALSKILSTRLCEYISLENQKFNYKTIIPCNLYGRHDKFQSKNSHMVAAVIKKLVDAKLKKVKVVDVWGDGTARREFMYAGDLADFILYAIKNFNKMPQNINVGVGQDYTITEYYQIIAKVIGYKGDFIYDTSKPTGMKQKLIDDTNLVNFGWKSKMKLEDGIKKTYNFYKNLIINE